MGSEAGVTTPTRGRYLDAAVLGAMVGICLGYGLPLLAIIAEMPLEVLFRGNWPPWCAALARVSGAATWVFMAPWDLLDRAYRLTCEPPLVVQCLLGAVFGWHTAGAAAGVLVQVTRTAGRGRALDETGV